MSPDIKDKDSFEAQVAVLPAMPGGDVAEEYLDYKHEKESAPAYDAIEEEEIAKDLGVTSDDLLEAEEYAKTLSLEDTYKILRQALALLEHDASFPLETVEKMKLFLEDEAILARPEDHAKLVHEMKIEAALIVDNSPYQTVRAVVPNTDDPTLPVSTVRAWTIGMGFVVLGAFVAQLFSIRQPSVTIGPVVSQLLSYPIAKAWERVLPDWGFMLFGERISLNPGPFNKKEHMLISIMAQVGFSTPYTDNIIWTQKLPLYFNQSFAGSFGYQILISLATNMIGYGVAGLCRHFLVYPVHCVWPTSLVTIALNSSFHNDTNQPVLGPLGRIFRASRFRAFMILFAIMFVYFWFPNTIAQFLSYFNWMTWIAPDNVALSVVTGSVNGLGLNPLPTFDWNMVVFNGDPLVLPFYNILSGVVGMFIGLPIILALWYTNTYNLGYLPINSNRTYDRFGKLFNISRVIDSRGILDPEGYQNYSQAYLAAGNLVVYIFFFAVYSAMISYAALYHSTEIAMGFKNLWKRKAPSEVHLDKHNRLMKAYKEVPEWWYAIVLAIAVAMGCAGIAAFPTYTSVGVVFYGIALCIIFVIPIGIIYAVTGMQITLNVLAEFIGGAWVEGNATSLNFFKSFGYVTAAHALAFSSDLKLGHYCKIPPRHTFAAQIAATLVSTFVCVGVLNFQMNKIEGVCTPTQANHFTCPGINTFFTAAVLWGTIGPRRVFGVGGQYSWTLMAFPIGLLFPLPFWYFRRKYPRNAALRNLHPVILLVGNLMWAPYNLAYCIAGVPIGWLSMIYVKRRFLAFWSKYNYVIAAAFSAAIAISAIIQFFAISWPGLEVDWWGNTVSYQGCEGAACRLLPIPEKGYFGPDVGSWK